MRKISFVGALALAAGASFAAPILEVEGNNTFATGNVLTAAQDSAFQASNSFVFDGSITPGNASTQTAADVDFVIFSLTGDSYLTASLFGIPNSSVGDSVLVLYRNTAPGVWAVVGGDDDNGLGAFSALEATVSAGTYALGIAMFPDATTTGGFAETLDGLNSAGAPITGEAFNYKLVVGFNPTTIPTPGALALAGAGLVVAGRRRR